MSAQPDHDTYETPFWTVQGVFDPDGERPDFSYTIGLHGRGIPELHIWAQPDEGDDPGADWKLGQHDRCHLLNEFADLALRGQLGTGSELVRAYDAGHTRLRFRIGSAADRDVLEAYGIAPGASVLPVHWSLHRAAEGSRAGLSADDEREAAAVFREIRDGLVGNRRAPTGLSVPRTPSFEPGGRFGPRTPVVLARAAQLWQADDETLADLLHAAFLVESSGTSLSYPAAVARALARQAGRTACLDELHGPVHELVDWLTARPAATARWRRVVRALDGDGWATARTSERNLVAGWAAGMLHDLLRMCLSVEVVADLADEDLIRHAHGPWLSGLRRGDLVPGEAWHAPAHILEVVGGVLAPLDVEALATVGGRHELARAGRVLEAPGYGELSLRLAGWALVARAGCAWEPTLSSLPGWRRLLDSAPHARIAPVHALQHWATCLCSALVHRQRLSADDVRAFAAPFRADLPDLEHLLNSPL